ncbi:hypothetical protein COB28_02405 [Candidatus Dependentiae bacterium]|nr:MAG: hypothetical protein COB28_02405 [Candidatus Dependentiae bacterium]
MGSEVYAEMLKPKKVLSKSSYDHRAVQVRENMQPAKSGSIFVTPGTVLSLSGQIAQEHVAIRNGRTLNEEVGDWLWKFRQRIDLRWHSQFFAKNKKKPAAEAVINFLNLHWWKESYSNLYIKTEPAFITNNAATGHIVTPDLSFEQVTTSFYEPSISSHIPVFSFTEGWLATYFHRWVKELAHKPHFIKVGYFPYQLGRGITLGPSDEGGIEYLGYNVSALPFNSPYFAPGILWHGTVMKHVSYELYYSLLAKRYNAPFERDALFFRFRLDKDCLNKFGKDVASQLWAAKVIARPYDDSNRSLYSEGYIMWHHSTLNAAAREQNIVDRTTDVGTFGCMFDVRYKQLQCNIECAGQIGGIIMHPFDTNDLKLQKNSSGFAAAVCTKIRAAPMEPYVGTLEFNTESTVNAPATDALLNIVNDELLVRLSSEKPLQSRSGDTIIDLATGAFVKRVSLNTRLSNLRNGGSPTASAVELLKQAESRYIQCFNAQDRVRERYKIELEGFLCAIDFAYMMKRFPCSLHFAGAYISGGNNPFSEQVDTTYKGFVPLRDVKYRGHFVKSLALLGSRVIPRPSDGLWHQQDSSNLAYAGIGFHCNPLEDRSKLSLESNLLWFFQPVDQKMFRIDQEESETRLASKDLGVELNGTMQYHPVKNLTLMFRGALFFPGKLYKDREAQMMSFMKTDGKLEQTKIGQDVTWGYHVRLAYHF